MLKWFKTKWKSQKAELSIQNDLLLKEYLIFPLEYENFNEKEKDQFLDIHEWEKVIVKENDDGEYPYGVPWKELFCILCWIKYPTWRLSWLKSNLVKNKKITDETNEILERRPKHFICLLNEIYPLRANILKWAEQYPKNYHIQRIARKLKSHMESDYVNVSINLHDHSSASSE